MSQTLERVVSVSIDFRRAPEVSLRAVVPILRQRQRRTVSSARQYERGCWRVIEGTGDLDLQVVPLLRSLTVGAPPHVVFDLRRVTFLDAGVLGILVATRAHQGRAHGAVRLVGPSPMVRKVIALTELDSVLPAFESFDQAVAGHESC
jgi:anti-sigma B factor antagonist